MEKSFCLFFSSLKDIKKRNILGYLVPCPSFSCLKLSFNHSKVGQPGPKTQLGITQGRSRALILPGAAHSGASFAMYPKTLALSVLYTELYAKCQRTRARVHPCPTKLVASTRGAGSIATGRLIRCAGTKQACTDPDT